MSFIKLRHIHTAKLTKIVENWSYQDYENIATQKFPELEGSEIYFVDVNGTILEEDVLVDYINHYKNCNQFPEIVILKQHDRNSDNNSVASTVSLIPDDIVSFHDSSFNDSISLASDAVLELDEISEIDDSDKENVPSTSQSLEHSCPIGTLCQKQSDFRDVTLSDWKSSIITRGGENIFGEYEEKGLLSNRMRMKLVNIMCSMLTEKYGVKVPNHEKEGIARIIVSLFPNLKDPIGKKGYEAFFTNRNGGEGYIAWRLRTITRNLNKGKVMRKRKLSEEISQKQHRRIAIKSAEISEAIEYIKNSNSNDFEGIRNKMKISYEYRKSIGEEDFWTEFPRFQDLPFLVEIDFILAGYDNAHFESIFNADVDKIISIYLSSVKHQLRIVTNEGWSKNIKAILALAHMLPTPAIHRNKGDCLDIEKKIFVFKPINTPLIEIIGKRDTNQPFLVAQGYNVSAISQYNIIVDGRHIPCPTGCSAVKAFEQLFMCHYVFNVKYDLGLKHFWQFVQTYYFKILEEDVVYTAKMIELRTRIQNNSE